ncbi:hypothetical protein [Mycobacterium intracellulare]|uniref:hypothetical protein n=1 Tax=Mycobacterium intracellulare TaxID=1767 RepID=UPI000CE3F5B1|nr:hypothetical protein [Mycobacterium intracellulare]
MSERIDLGDSGAYTFDQEASRCEVYVGPADCPISPRLLEALSNGTATAGGLVVGWWSNRGSNPKLHRDAELIVSTVWLGMNHAWDGGLAIFETMIFGGDYSEYQMRYATEAEALAGHQRTVDDLLAGREPWFIALEES